MSDFTAHFEQFNSLNAEQAKNAYGGDYIKRTGKYIGVFKQAVCFEAPSGAKGIEFEFKSESGEQAGFSIFTGKRDGTEAFGANQVQAIMTCLKQRSAGMAFKKASVWDNHSRTRTEKDVPQLTALLDKPIGVLIQMEEYEANSGSRKWKATFAHAFAADTELTADEILASKAEPQRLQKLVANLADKPLKDKDGNAPFNASKPQPMSSNPPADNFDDEDIPF